MSSATYTSGLVFPSYLFILERSDEKLSLRFFVQLVAPNSNPSKDGESKSKATNTSILNLSRFCKHLSQFATVVALWLLSFSAFSQSQVVEKTYDLITKDGISISSALQNCDDVKNGISKEYVLLSVLNENTYPVELSFKKDLWFDGKRSSTSPKHVVSIKIEANGKANGSCHEKNNLRIFSKMRNLDNVRKLTNYELVDITVDEIK
ncbi:hypothetical protein N9J52_02335 [Flavobacteriales bacterium]|nr:hypothetical protein [Flavobacteriales bacterium]